jgi:hypothetical protein
LSESNDKLALSIAEREQARPQVKVKRIEPRPMKAGFFVGGRKKVIRSIRVGGTKKNGFRVKPLFLLCVKEAEQRQRCSG